MYYFTQHILHHLGATVVRMPDSAVDPESEADFLQLDYESNERYTWEQYCEAKVIVQQTIGLNYLRSYRNKCLADCDWLMTVDNTERIQNIQEWKTYRQALRDLPENQPPFVWKEGVLDFANMILPSKPTIQYRTPS
jgi:hypothetical protein